MIPLKNIVWLRNCEYKMKLLRKRLAQFTTATLMIITLRNELPMTWEILNPVLYNVINIKEDLDFQGGSDSDVAEEFDEEYSSSEEGDGEEKKGKL